MTDFFLFSSIRDYLYARIAYFTEHVLSQNLTLALTVILGLLTVWVMIQGYLIAVGKSHEGLKGFILNMFKTYFVVAIALGTASGGSFGVRFMTETLTDGISQIMTGNSDVGTKCLMQETQTIVGCKIDQNLAATQAMMATLSGIDTADDDYLEGKLTEARWFAGVGTAGPAIVAGGMLMVFRVGMSLFIGFAPIFILCLLFKKTAPLFQKWLYYGLATIFSGVLLGVMADISMDLVAHIAATSAIADITSMVLTGQAQAGIMQNVTQQLGLGLFLSVMLITIPPMAGSFFNGVMASFSPYSVFDRWNGNGGGSLPPHLDGGASRQLVEQRVNDVREQINQTHQNRGHQYNPANAGYTNSSSPSIDPNAIKPFDQTQLGLAKGSSNRPVQPKNPSDEEQQ